MIPIQSISQIFSIYGSHNVRIGSSINKKKKMILLEDNDSDFRMYQKVVDVDEKVRIT